MQGNDTHVIVEQLQMAVWPSKTQKKLQTRPKFVKQYPLLEQLFSNVKGQIERNLKYAWFSGC